MTDTPDVPQPNFLPKIITIFREGYGGSDLVRDLLAGLAVAIVALPLSIAIAVASGASPQVGLVTLVVGGLLISLIGGSRTQIGGPTAAFIVVVFGVIHDHGFDGLVLATFMAGFILIIGAFLRLGGLVRYVPEPVIRGFTFGIAIVIAVSQIKDLFGMADVPLPIEFVARIEALWDLRDTINWLAFLTGIGAIAIIVGLRRLWPKFPGIVIAALAAALAISWLGLPVETIADRFGALSFSIPSPSLPDISIDRVRELLPSALVIAFLAGVESLLSAAVADRLTGHRHRSNAEVLAQGVANLGSALVGGLPATGALARTATNIRAGGRSPVAGIAHALFVLAFLLFAAPLIGYLAMPSLAAILLTAAWSMSEPERLKAELTGPREDALVFVLTALLTIFADLTLAITIGTIVALLLRFRRRNVPPPDWKVPDR